MNGPELPNSQPGMSNASGLSGLTAFSANLRAFAAQNAQRSQVGKQELYQQLSAFLRSESGTVVCAFLGATQQWIQVGDFVLVGLLGHIRQTIAITADGLCVHQSSSLRRFFNEDAPIKVRFRPLVNANPLQELVSKGWTSRAMSSFLDGVVSGLANDFTHPALVRNGACPKRFRVPVNR